MDTLFDMPEPHRNKYVEPNISKADRVRKMVKRNDPSTSYMAAEVALKSLESNRQKVLEIFAEVSPEGLIDEELESIAQSRGMRPQGASKRRSDLSRDGLLVHRGEYRNTDSGCRAKVWYKA